MEDSKMKLDEKDKSKAKELIGQLKEIAEKAGCGVEELIEMCESGEEYSEEKPEGDDSKLSMIVARMKSKGEPSLEG